MLNEDVTTLSQPVHLIALITLPDSDTGMDSDSDSKPNGNIALCRTCSHCTDSALWRGTLVEARGTLVETLTPYFCMGQESESESYPCSSPVMCSSHYCQYFI